MFDDYEVLFKKFFFKDFAAGYANQLCSYPQHSKLGQTLNINNLLINLRSFSFDYNNYSKLL